VRIDTHPHPRGPAQNFSQALSLASGELIALADQDDVWHPDKLATQVAWFGKDPGLLLLHTDALLVDRGGKPTGSLFASLRVTRTERAALVGGQGIRALLRRNLVTGATVMLRSTLVDVATPIPAGWMHDEWLGLVAALHDGLAWDPAQLIHYRQHDANQVGASSLSAAEAKSRLGERRSVFFAKKRQRNQALIALLEASPDWLLEHSAALLVAKMEHDQWRAELPDNRLHRIIPVLGRVPKGHYQRFARGYIDVVRDLWLRG